MTNSHSAMRGAMAQAPTLSSVRPRNWESRSRLLAIDASFPRYFFGAGALAGADGVGVATAGVGVGVAAGPEVGVATGTAVATAVGAAPAWACCCICVRSGVGFIVKLSENSNTRRLIPVGPCPATL